MSAAWRATETEVFFSKNDPDDVRLGDCVQALNLEKSFSSLDAHLLLWGYPDDEGIKLNGGRPGAALAPHEIRKVFYKMTPHPGLPSKAKLLDAGNISTDLPLSERHSQGAQFAQTATDSGLSWASLGGGHDYGYADGAGFLRSVLKKNQRPLIINFDAHLDVRSSEKNLNSGTPFYRLLSEFEGKFDFFEIGLQPQCNSSKHLQWAQQKGAHCLFLSEVEEKGLLTCLKESLSPHLGQPLWLSLDMDAITSTEAPGCSQSWTTGIKSRDLLQALSWLHKTFSWKAFSLYEASPALDFDNHTSKLAALFLHHYLSLNLNLNLSLKMDVK